MWIGQDAPQRRGGGFRWKAYAWAIACVVLATGVNQVVFTRFDEANLVMVYLLAMVPVALRGNWGAAVATAVLSVFAFDFFFVPPFYTFAVSDTQYFFTFLVMGLVGGLLSTYTARLAAEVAETRRRETQARALYELSRSMLAARAPAEVLAEGARVIGAELGVEVNAWLKSPGGEPIAVTSPAQPLSASEHELLRWVVMEGEPAGTGTATFPGSALLFLPVRTPTRLHGALGLRPPADEARTLEAVRAALETGANQLAIALDQARAREEAEAARHQADVERMRSALLSSVSHDLRTPLTGIVGAAGALVEGAEALDADTRRELAQGIVEEGDRLSRLVTNLLQATRLDAGAAQLSREWTPLEELVGPALARLARELAAHGVEVELPADLPLLHVDAVLLEQALVNLLENAAKYAPAGTPIAIKAERLGDQVAVEVADRGPGLPPGEEARLFEKFRRYPRGGAPGAGLGLAIARGVVEAHGGTLTAANRPGGGAAFRMVLPVPPDGLTS